MSTLKTANIATQDGSYSIPTDVVTRASCRAWVNFNGTGTVAIRASYNVSSITDNGVGDYTVNFTSAMVDANYSIAIGASNAPAGSNQIVYINDGTTLRTQNLFRMSVVNIGGTANGDSSYVNVSIFR